MFNILISKHYVKCSDWLIYRVFVLQIVQSEHRIYRYDVMIGYFTIMDTTCTWNVLLPQDLRLLLTWTTDFLEIEF